MSDAQPRDSHTIPQAPTPNTPFTPVASSSFRLVLAPRRCVRVCARVHAPVSRVRGSSHTTPLCARPAQSHTMEAPARSSRSSRSSTTKKSKKKSSKSGGADSKAVGRRYVCSACTASARLPPRPCHTVPRACCPARSELQLPRTVAHAPHVPPRALTRVAASPLSLVAGCKRS